jgi:hypothetical protein
MASPEYWPTPHYPEMTAVDASVVAVELFPREYIEVVVNDQARDMLPKSLKHLASPEYLSAACYVTVPLTSSHKKRVLVANSWKRALPIGYGEIPYGHIVGSTVMSKGGWISGSALSHLEELTTMHGNPWGLFGEHDANVEANISNALLDTEFRSSLTLGYAALNAEKFQAFLVAKWKNHPHAQTLIKSGFEMLEKHRQEPVQLFRVTGVTERVHVHTVWSHGPSKRAEFRRAAKALIAQFEYFPQHFGRLVGVDVGVNKTVETLRWLRDGNLLTAQDIHILSDLCIGIIVHNAYALMSGHRKVNSMYPGWDFKAKDLAAEKDITILDYIAQDYEAAIEKITNLDRPVNHIRLYMDTMSQTHDMMLSQLHRFLGDPNEPTSQPMAQEDRLLTFSKSIINRFTSQGAAKE